MDGALTFTHVCVDSSQAVLEHHRPFQRDPLIRIYVDSSQTVLEHHRPFQRDPFIFSSMLIAAKLY